MLSRRDQRHEVVVVTNVIGFVLQVLGQDQKPQPGAKSCVSCHTVGGIMSRDPDGREAREAVPRRRQAGCRTSRSPPVPLRQTPMSVKAAADALHGAEDKVSAARPEGDVLARFQRDQAAAFVPAQGEVMIRQPAGREGRVKRSYGRRSTPLLEAGGGEARACQYGVCFSDCGGCETTPRSAARPRQGLCAPQSRCRG